MFFSLFVLLISTLHAQQVEIWSGPVINGNDNRTLTIEISKENEEYSARWSLSGAYLYRIPMHSFSYNPGDSLTGTLHIFNFDVGTVKGFFSKGTIAGTLTWHKSVCKFSLTKQKYSELPFDEKEYTIRNNDITLSGTLITPKEKGPFPVVVYLHGSGPAERWWPMYYAKEFAKTGVAFFAYDKRGSGKSTGSWVSASLNDLTSDASAVIRFLKTVDKINPDKIGTYAVSQGGWITSKLAVSETRPAFSIVNSGGGATPYDEELFSYKKNLERGSFSNSEKEEAIKLVKEYMKYLKTGKDREGLVKKINKAKNEKWYRFINVDRILPTEEGRKYWEWVAKYDPLPDIVKMNYPVLILMGLQDTEHPVDEAIARWREGLNKADNNKYEIKIYQDVGHALRVGGHTNFNAFPSYEKGSMQYQLNWLNKNVLSK